jgi:hypothetical protein
MSETFGMGNSARCEGRQPAAATAAYQPARRAASSPVAVCSTQTRGTSAPERSTA